MLGVYSARRPIFRLLAPLAGRPTFRLPAPLLDSTAGRTDYPSASPHAVPRCNVCLEVPVAVTLSPKIHSGYRSTPKCLVLSGRESQFDCISGALNKDQMVVHIWSCMMLGEALLRVVGTDSGEMCS
ncbi:uncharacterized protein LOC124691903 isoform X2 [Lolium rigidum]|uniref:uncharacterized protein LOC124691903 isoform X2 n=1 Tax=Lolium rigidum TaxID=89674 RepID=UPI001F5D600B|nr:uncharacterized protein LOC124691903 isoform X2 [Lolium rigidum]